MIGASWEEPLVVVAAGGVAAEWTEDALDATISAIEARSLASMSTGASWEEPWIMPSVVGGPEVEPNVVLIKACVVASESSSHASLPLGLWSLSKL